MKHVRYGVSSAVGASCSLVPESPCAVRTWSVSSVRAEAVIPAITVSSAPGQEALEEHQCPLSKASTYNLHVVH